MAALGRGLTVGGMLDEAAMEQTLEALARFRALGKEMGLKKLHTVATAAVRDARNGPAFLKRVAALGLKPRLAVGGRGSRIFGARGDFGQSARARHRRRPWRGQPRTGRRRARRGGGGRLAPARRAARRRQSRPGSDHARHPRHRRPLATQGCGARARAVSGRGLVPRAGVARPQIARPPAADRPPASHRARAAGRARRGRWRRERRGAQGAHRAVVEPHQCVARGGGDPGGDDRSARPGTLRSRRPSGCARGCSTATSTPIRAPRIRCSRRRSRLANGSGASAIMAPRSTNGSIPCSSTKAPISSGCGSPPACSATSAGTRIPIFAPSARSTWRCTAIGSGSTRTTARCSGARCAARSAATAGSASNSRRCCVPGEDERAIAWGKAIRLAQRLSGGTEALLRRSSLALQDRRLVLTVQPRYRELASGAVERRLAQLAKALGRSPAIAFG